MGCGVITKKEDDKIENNSHDDSKSKPNDIIINKKVIEYTFDGDDIQWK